MSEIPVLIVLLVLFVLFWRVLGEGCAKWFLRRRDRKRRSGIENPSEEPRMSDVIRKIDAWVLVDGPDPTVKGWYGVISYYDMAGGNYPDAVYWDGVEWPVLSWFGYRSPEPFPDEDTAQNWAYENNPEL